MAPNSDIPFKNINTVNLLNKLEIFVTNEIKDAKFIVLQCVKTLLRYTILFDRKKYLVWTNKPRYDTNFKTTIQLPIKYSEIKIMNVYGQDIFWNNFHFLSSYHFNTSNNLGIPINQILQYLNRKDYYNKIKKIAAFFTFTDKGELINNRLNIDLTQKRCLFAMEGLKKELWIFLVMDGRKEWPKLVQNLDSKKIFHGG